MQTPLVSIIIPSYNRAHIIGATLESVLAQTYANWECIVVDDGSTDATPELMASYVKKDSRFFYFQRPNHMPKGPNSCRNYGFENCNGEYVNFFDSDDLYKPHTFEKMSTKFSLEVDAIVAKTELVKSETKEVISVNKINSNKLIEDYFVGNITFYVGGAFWKKSFLKAQEELFDEAIGNIDDWDFNLRMLYKNPRIIFIEEVLMQYIEHSDSFSSELRKLNKQQIASDFKARNKHFELIKNRKNIDIDVIKGFIVERYNRYLKIALIKDNSIKYFLFKELLKQELRFKKYKLLLRSVFGFTIYILFKRGYRYLKL